MKRCSKCKKGRSYDEFYKDKTAKDGYNSICKLCRLEMDRKRRKTDPDWVKRRKEQNKKFHEENKEKIAERKKRWLASEKGKESHRKSNKKYKEKFPEKKKAHDAIYRAVKKGELFKPSHCQICGEEGNTEAHHARYGREQRTSVIWVCKICHSKLT